MGPDDFSGHRTRRTGSMHRPFAVIPSARDPSARHGHARPSASAITPRATSSHLTQVIDIGPGEPGQLVHRDQWAF